MAKWVALTARKLKPGHVRRLAAGLGLRRRPGRCHQAYICRNVNDPDEIVAFGIIEAIARAGAGDEACAEVPRRPARRRWRRTSSRSRTDGFYEVIEEVTV